MNGKKLLLSVVVIQAGLIVGLWYGPGANTALAQIPDSGAQRAQQIQLMQAQNDKLDKIIELLSGGNLQVRVAKPEEK